MRSHDAASVLSPTAAPNPAGRESGTLQFRDQRNWSFGAAFDQLK